MVIYVEMKQVNVIIKPVGKSCIFSYLFFDGYDTLFAWIQYFCSS